jgi:hypothetical protein
LGHAQPVRDLLLAVALTPKADYEFVTLFGRQPRVITLIAADLDIRITRTHAITVRPKNRSVTNFDSIGQKSHKLPPKPEFAGTGKAGVSRGAVDFAAIVALAQSLCKRNCGLAAALA